MNSLNDIVKQIMPILPAIAAANLPPQYRHMVERAQQAEIAACQLERRLQADRDIYGISEAEQARLLSMGLYETAVAMMAIDKNRKTSETMTNGVDGVVV